MKALTVVIVLAVLAVGTMVWAGARDGDQGGWQQGSPMAHGTQRGEVPRTDGDYSRTSPSGVVCPYDQHNCTHWYGWLIPGHSANCHSGCYAGGGGQWRAGGCC